MGFDTCLVKVKQTSENTSLLWFVGFLLCLAISMLLLIRATQTIPMGTAYGVWTGIVAVGTALVGIFLFSEPADFWRIFFISTLIISIVGLKMVSLK